MQFRNIFWNVALVVTFFLDLAMAHGETWDACGDFHASDNNANATWQYVTNTPGTNTGYTSMGTFGTTGWSYNAWKGDVYWFVGKDPSVPTELRVHPNDSGSAAIAWKSPGAMTVDVSFSVTDRDGGGGDGVEYWLFKSGNSTALSHGIVSNGTGSGNVVVADISVASGDMLYLQIGSGSNGNSYYDLTGVNFTVARAMARVTWDANSGFHTTGNDANATWQYLVNTAGVNTSYSFLSSYAMTGWGYNAWRPVDDAYWMVGKDPSVATELRVHPNQYAASVIAWKSPAAMTVDVSFSATDRDSGGGDGIEYWLFKSGSSIALSHAVVSNGGASGTIAISGMTVAAGDMLYLQVGAGSASNSYYDLTGVNFTITRTDAWNAYDGFHTAANDTDATWQYLSNTPGANTGYSYMNTYAMAGWGYNAWQGSAYWMIGKDPAVTTELRVHPNNNASSVIAWKSPEAMSVDVRFSLNDRDTGGGDGVEYWLFKSGATAPLSHASVANDGTSGTVVVFGVPVATGDLLYLQIGPGASNSYYDLTGVTFSIARSVSRGHQILLQRGLQLQTLSCIGTMSNEDFNSSRWDQSNYTAVQIWGAGLFGGYPAARMATAPNTPWGFLRYYALGDVVTDIDASAVPYASTLVSYQFQDEQDITNSTELACLATSMAGFHVNRPNVITYTNQGPATQFSTAAVQTYMQTVQPDMICFDRYPFNGNLTGGSPTLFYSDLQVYRTFALAGNDGTGAQPIPCGIFTQTSTGDHPNNHFVTESEVRLNNFAAWAFGYKFVSSFLYEYNSDISGCPQVLFSGPGTGTTTAQFDYVAETNRQSRNLGPALVRLLSSDIRMICGKVNGTSNTLPSGVSTWTSTAGGCSYITSIEPRGTSNTSNPSTHADWLIGYFIPLRWDNSDYAYANGLHFMVVNGATSPTSGVSASSLGEWVRMEFDFTGTNFTQLQRLSRTTGQIETVSLTSLGNNHYRLDLKLDGGTGDLFRFYPQ